MNSIASNNAFSQARPVQKYSVKPELLHLFETVGAQGKNYFSISELKEFLGQYIKSKQLLDPLNCLSINATNDPLGQVFGQEKFHAIWALKRLHSFLIPLGTAPDSGIESGTSQSNSDRDDNALKRKFGDATNPNPKRFCSEYFFEIPHPPSVKGDSETETVYSLQGYETAVAKDSEDDFFSSLSNDEDDYAVLTDWDNDFEPTEAARAEYNDFHDGNSDLDFEYEVTSLPSDLDSDSAPSVGDAMEVIVQEVETDIDFWADSSNCELDSTTSEDPDITDSDKWMCKHCKSLNYPTIRYCQRCWQLRQNWLPENRPRPPKRLRKKRKREGQRRKNRSNAIKRIELEALVEEPVAGPSQDISSKSSDSTEDNLCFMCRDRPCDGCIVHGSTGHMIGCYKCLKTLKHKDKPCPICRAPILKVIRVFKD